MGGVIGIIFGFSVLATDALDMRSLIDASGDVGEREKVARPDLV